MLDFLFERNEQDEISNIYNYPRGRGATQTIILRTVNCNCLEDEIKTKIQKILQNSSNYNRIESINR